MSVERKFATKTVGAQNIFSDAFQIDKGQVAAISLAGTLAASTVWLQRRFNPTGDWRDVSSYTAAAELSYAAECGMEIRAGIKTGGYGGADSVIIDFCVG